MTDLTEVVLASSFALALAVFVISAALRAIRSARSTESASFEPQASGGFSPYEAPRQVAPPPLPPALPAGRVPVWFFQPVDLIGAAFVFMVFSGFFMMASGAPKEPGALNPTVLLINIGFQFTIAGIVAVLAMRRATPNVWLGLRWGNWPWVLLIAPAAVGFMWMVFGGLQASGYVKWMESLGVETTQETVKLLQKSEDPLILGLMAVAAVIAAPLCEEIVFRGYFYPVMKRFAGIWPAAFCSALVFGAAHGNLTALLPLFIFGGLLVFLYEKTGSIWAPIAVHFCFNGATVLVQMATRYFDIPIQPTP
jgi:membrane protease YdiL (CAAX protease family)